MNCSGSFRSDGPLNKLVKCAPVARTFNIHPSVNHGC